MRDDEGIFIAKMPKIPSNWVSGGLTSQLSLVSMAHLKGWCRRCLYRGVVKHHGAR